MRGWPLAVYSLLLISCSAGIPLSLWWQHPATSFRPKLEAKTQAAALMCGLTAVICSISLAAMAIAYFHFRGR